MKLSFPLFVLGLAVPALGAIDTNLDPLKVGGSIYKLKAEDSDIRVMEVTFNPGQKIAMHEHPKHMVYVLQGGSLKIHEEGKEPQIMNLKPGDTVTMPAQKHEAQNVGKTKIKLLVTELKNKM